MARMEVFRACRGVVLLTVIGVTGVTLMKERNFTLQASTHVATLVHESVISRHEHLLVELEDGSPIWVDEPLFFTESTLPGGRLVVLYDALASRAKIDSPRCVYAKTIVWIIVDLLVIVLVSIFELVRAYQKRKFKAWQAKHMKSAS